tara:strand:- start:1099 stop:1659 length:561 start_codon:yes stop_codon:yes gene_type:complete
MHHHLFKLYHHLLNSIPNNEEKAEEYFRDIHKYLRSHYEIFHHLKAFFERRLQGKSTGDKQLQLELETEDGFGDWVKFEHDILEKIHELENLIYPIILLQTDYINSLGEGFFRAGKFNQWWTTNQEKFNKLITTLLKSSEDIDQIVKAGISNFKREINIYLDNIIKLEESISKILDQTKTKIRDLK